MASTAENFPLPLELRHIGSKPLVLRFNRGNPEEPPTILDPFDSDLRESRLQMETLDGKQCLACLQGEWLLLLDKGTKECVMMSLASFSKISLPPLLAPVEKLGSCVLSSSTPPDCTVMFAATEEKQDDSESDEDGSDEDDDEDTGYMLYCRPGDKDWWGLYDDENDHAIDKNSITMASQGTVYVRTDRRTFIAIDASLSSSDEATIERRGIPHPTRMRWACNEEYLVESDGDVFLLQFYTHGFRNSEVVDMDIHRLDTSVYAWKKVESIGDRTFFVGDDNCVALSSASRAELRPDSVHLLHKDCRDGIRLYTIQLDDRKMSCNLLLLPTSSDDIYYWVVPSSFKKESKQPLAISSKANNKNKHNFVEDLDQVVAPWASLPVDVVEGLVSRISFTDYLNVREVCKGWNCISKPIAYAERYPTYPLLMSICPSSKGVFKLFDPVIQKEYTVKNNGSLVPSDDYFQMLVFAKHGWVLVMGGDKHIYAANPFTGERIDLPERPQNGNQFDGISFSSAPNSPDCTVCCIHKLRNSGRTDLLHVLTWHPGDEHWTKEDIGDETQFRTAYSNPVFYHGEFYCLGTRGNLGVFNPDNMIWRVLDKPEPILDGDPMTGEQHCQLLEFKDDLFAIFRPHDRGPIALYRLDKVRMVWTVVEKFEGEVIFVDNWNAIMTSSPRDAFGNNRIYMPKLGGCNKAGEADKGAFYDFQSRKYHPNYYGLTERMNSIWVEPNSSYWEILISN
ncbi:hypothetical protein EJB05_19370, partial [Eragrostis curvula]